jgi:hypothetical protein
VTESLNQAVVARALVAQNRLQPNAHMRNRRKDRLFVLFQSSRQICAVKPQRLLKRIEPRERPEALARDAPIRTFYHRSVSSVSSAEET